MSFALLSTLALKGALVQLAGAYQAAKGVTHRCRFCADPGLLKRLRGGENADVVILTREGLDELVRRRSAWCRQAASIWRAPMSASR